MKILFVEQHSVLVEYDDDGRYNVVNNSTPNLDTIARFDCAENAQNYADGFNVGESIAISQDDYPLHTPYSEAQSHTNSLVNGLIDGLMTGGIINIEFLEEAIARHSKLTPEEIEALGVNPDSIS